MGNMETLRLQDGSNIYENTEICLDIIVFEKFSTIAIPERGWYTPNVNDGRHG